MTLLKRLPFTLFAIFLSSSTLSLVSYIPFNASSFSYYALSSSIPGKTSSVSVFSDYDPTGLILSGSIASARQKDAPPIIFPPETKKEPTATYGEPDLLSNIKETEITKGGTSLFGVEINNETSFDLENSLRDVTRPENPTVLIIHTHTSESYRSSPAFPYIPTDNSRTEDSDYNVSRVGKELANELSSYGINVIHDSTLNDYPSYNGSYSKALKLIESHLKKNPTIDMIIDIHRDAMERADGTKISTVFTLNNEKAAQVMLVAGTDESGLYHPSWQDNFSFAVNLQSIINKEFPNMARPINLRKERFNGHVSKKELIIEVGTTGNTLEEALRSARALAFAINKFYTG